MTKFLNTKSPHHHTSTSGRSSATTNTQAPSASTKLHGTIKTATSCPIPQPPKQARTTRQQMPANGARQKTRVNSRPAMIHPYLTTNILHQEEPNPPGHLRRKINKYVKITPPDIGTTLVALW